MAFLDLQIISQVAFRLFCFLAFPFADGTAKDSVACEPLWPKLSCSHSSPPAPWRQKELWPGCCPRAPNRRQHVPLDSGTSQNVFFPRALPEERWTWPSPPLSRPYESSASFGVGNVIKTLCLIIPSFKYYCHTASLCF